MMNDVVIHYGAVAVYILSKLSCAQCCIWSCSNHKKKRLQDDGGAMVCECSNVRFTDCHKPANTLTLYSINHMSESTKTENCADQSNEVIREDKAWYTTEDCFICKLHITCGFISPSRKSPNKIPILEYFSRLMWSVPDRKKQRIPQRTNWEESPFSGDSETKEEIQSQSVS